MAKWQFQFLIAIDFLVKLFKQLRQKKKVENHEIVLICVKSVLLKTFIFSRVLDEYLAYV